MSQFKITMVILTTCYEMNFIYSVSQKQLHTFEMAAELKVYDSVGKGLGVWIAYGLKFHMAPKNPTIIYDWVSTAHGELKIRLRRNGPFP